MIKKVIFLLLSVFLFTGCYDYNELNDLAIVSGMAIAYDENEYETTFEIMVTKKNDSGKKEESETMLVTGAGKTPAIAINNTIGKTDKKVLFNQLQIVLLDESVAQKGIKEISNYLFRDIHISNNFYYIISKETSAKDVLKAKIKNEPVVTNAILDLFNNQNDVELLDLHSEFDYIYAKLKDGKQDITIPSVNLKNNTVALATVGVFQKDKLISYLTKEESQTFYLLNSKVTNAFYYDDDASISIYKNKAKFKIKDNQLNVELNAQAAIKSLNEKANLREDKTNKELSKQFSQKIKKDVEQLIKKSKEINSDFLGLSSIYYRSNPSKYQNDSWKQLDYKIKVNLEVNRNGQTFEVIN